jgi:hypothetical protein
MVSKILAVIALMLLPLSVLLWRQSVAAPVQHRYDVTLYKSLRIYLIDGVCGLRLLSLPTKTASKTGFHAELTYNPTPKKSSLILTTTTQGPYKVTWLVFPLWLTTGVLSAICCLPIVTGPLRQGWRRWRGLCIACGYNLHGNRSGRCSECGLQYR